MNQLCFRKPVVLSCALLALLAISVFGQVRTFDFINQDDPMFVYENPHIIHGFSLEGIHWAFTADLFKDSPDADYWRPLTFLSHMFDAEFYGANPSGHHLTNLIFHIFNSLILFLFLYYTTDKLPESLLITSLFTIHPLQAQTVSWITARKDLLSTFFGLITLWTYAIHTRNSLNKYFKIIPIFCFALGLMTKPMLMILPGLMIVFDIWPLKRIWNINLLREKIPYGILSIASFIILTAGKTRALVDVPDPLQGFNILFNLKEYLIHVFFPIHLSIYAPVTAKSLSIIQISIILILLIAVSFALLLQTKRRPYLGTGWLWFVLSIAPSILLTRADRFMYLPMIGILILTVFATSEISSYLKIHKTLKWSAGILLIATLLPISYHTASHWQNGITLFSSVVAKNPQHYRAHYILGLALAQDNQMDRATEHFLNALDGSQKDSGIYNEIGLLLMKRGRLKQAVTYFQKASRAYSNPVIQAISYNNMANAFKQMGKPKLARIYYHKALRLDPEYAQPHYNLGQLAYEYGEKEFAVQRLEKAIEISPYFEEARVELGSLLARDGRMSEAINQFESILKFNPRSLMANNNLGGILLNAGRAMEAKKYFETALKYNPNYEPARKNLAIIEAALQTYQNQNTQK